MIWMTAEWQRTKLNNMQFVIQNIIDIEKINGEKY